MAIPPEHWHRVFYENAYGVFDFSQLKLTQPVASTNK
jgi:hypothetical protein